MITNEALKRSGDALPGEIQISNTPTKDDHLKLGLDYLEKHLELWDWAEEKGKRLYAKATDRGPVMYVINADLVLGEPIGLGVYLNIEFREKLKQMLPQIYSPPPISITRFLIDGLNNKIVL